jgi:TATA-binding protein-associated factor Taf7
MAMNAAVRGDDSLLEGQISLRLPHSARVETDVETRQNGSNHH